MRTIAVLHAEGRNARADDMYLAMTRAIESAQHNSAIRCIVVAGGFDVFATGVGTSGYRAVGGGAPEGLPPQNVIGLLNALANNAKPIIAAVEGATAGIGTAIVFYCDQVIAAASATFTSPLDSHDLVPDGAMSSLIPRRLAQQRAFAMLVPGRSMRVERAYESGLIDMIVPPGQAAIEAGRVAEQLCRLPAEAASEATASRPG
ncbi:enoyl-CoA hydratase-related protein [Bradyrhizobium tropiciagri]|uniref:enoyl-CoA hydratase-related protein n=1 Tax=Bradyrhizobium tropiciagri TaxID=312253 RepID=UPI0012FEF246|nr:enoyl-CoA hydratase-related protein [Bradyrhizobium tropiciagri]